MIILTKPYSQEHIYVHTYKHAQTPLDSLHNKPVYLGELCLYPFYDIFCRINQKKREISDGFTYRWCKGKPNKVSERRQNVGRP